MPLITVKSGLKRVLYTIPISLILTEEELHIANSSSYSRWDLLDMVSAFTDYQNGFCDVPSIDDVMPQYVIKAGEKARKRLYEVVVTAAHRLSNLLPESASELAVMSFNRRNVDILVTLL